MKIPASQTNFIAPKYAAQAKGNLQNAPTQAANRSNTTSSAAGANGAASAPEAWSPSERLARYAESMFARLDALQQAEAGNDVDLGSVRADFEHHIQRLQDALASGSLSTDDLAHGIGQAVDLVRDGVREAMDLPTMQRAQAVESSGGAAGAAQQAQTTLDIDHTLGRLDAIQSSYQERLDNYLGSLAPNAFVQGQEAQNNFDHNFQRIRDAVSSGMLSAEDMHRAMANLMQHLEEDLAPTATLSAMTVDPGAGADISHAEQVGPQTAGSDQVALGAAPEASGEPAPLQPSAAAWTQFLANLQQQEQPSLTQLWQARTPVQSFLLGAQQDARQAQGLDAATYSAQAQLQMPMGDSFGAFLDLAA